MLKIGEFSKLSHLTIKALRFYEKEGLLVPKSIDDWTGYRFYETSQLEDAAKIKAYRQLGLSIEEIKEILSGADLKMIFAEKAEMLKKQKADIDVRLSIINHILEEEEMKYQVTVKEIRISAGAGFIVVLLGDVMTMPGLPKKPAALNIDIDEDGNVVGLF